MLKEKTEKPEDDIKLDWMPLKIDRFLSGIRYMSAAEIGAYTMLLIHQWENGFIPSGKGDIKRIAKINGKALDKVLEKFKPCARGLYNEIGKQIWDEQLKKYLENKAKGKKGAETRWQKHSRGNGSAIPPTIPLAIAEEEGEERIKKKELPKGNNLLQHTHNDFANDFFSESRELDRENLYVQIKKTLIPNDLAEFNSFLFTENKKHETFHEWIKHLRNWINKKPKHNEHDQRLSKNQPDEKIGRINTAKLQEFINRPTADGS